MARVCFKVVRKINGVSRCSCYSPHPYARRYLKGMVVEAEKNTLGILVFKARKQAEAFINSHKDLYFDSPGWKILRIEPIGRGKTPGLLAPGSSNSSERDTYDLFYSGKPILRERLMNAPEGTIGYPAVKVLN